MKRGWVRRVRDNEELWQEMHIRVPRPVPSGVCDENVYVRVSSASALARR
jgi:hypothetical protein